MLLPSIRSLIVSTSKLTCPRLFVQEFLSPTATEWNQNRGRKRNFKTGYSKEVKRLKRIAREEKEQKRKENKQRFLDNMMKGSGKKEIVKRITLRYEAENEVNLPDVPLTDVYFRDQVKTQFEPLRKALETYRMLVLNPIISNRTNALLKLRCELNMTGEKTGKFVSSSQELVLVPHPFSFSEQRILMAFIKDKILAEKAKEAGAELILGPDSIRKILKGQIKLDDYDFCLAYSDMASTILPLRGVLRYRYPNKLNGALTDDIVSTIEQFKKGVKINIVQSTSTLSWGTSEIVIGRLNMTDDEIEANVKVIIQALCKHRNPALGPFINRARLICRGVRHPYSIDLTEFMPVATDEQLEKMGRKKKKKKEKKVEESKEKENQEIIDPFIAYM